MQIGACSVLESAPFYYSPNNPLMMKLDHVGIAVDEIEHVLDLVFQLLGERPYKVEDVAPDSVRTHFIQGGSARLEFLEALDDDSPIARFVARRGAGLHHLAFEVEDIDAAFRRLNEGGFTLIDEEPRAGADGKRIFFLHPRDTAGILIEFCQSVRPVLRPVAEAPGFRQAGSPLGTPIVWASAGGPSDAVARRLETRFFLVVVDDPDRVSPAQWTKPAGDRPVHLIAGSDNAAEAAALAGAYPQGIRSLTFLGWAPIPAPPMQPILVIARNEDLGAVDTIQKSLPGVRVAILPFEDPAIVAALIEHHVKRAEIAA